MKRIKNRSIFILLTIILSLGITLGAVYYMYQYKDSRENQLKTSMISLNFTEKSEVINLTSNVPMIDDLGLKSRPYEFTITNTSTVPVKADIKLDVDNDTTIKYGAVRYALFINNERVIKDYVHRDNLTLYEVSELKPNEVINCKLYFWIDYYYDYPGEIFKAKIKAVGESIDELQQEAITVTFDADGGVLDTTTKEVYYHGYYGELPEPTREGYTFMGWNGKNMLNPDAEYAVTYNGSIRRDIVMYDENSGIYTTIADYNVCIYGYEIINIIEFNNDYTFSASIIKNNNGGGTQIGIDATKNGSRYVNSNKYLVSINERINYNLNLSNEFSSCIVGIAHNGYGTLGVEYRDLQLEEGDTATEYEPYYITSDTKVVQNGNHTLKAIWKENS